MPHLVGSDEPHLFHAHVGNGGPQGSGKAESGATRAVPDFVRKAVQAGFSAPAAAALYRKIAQTRADIRARRITPTGGMRRVERLALGVAVVGGGS